MPRTLFPLELSANDKNDLQSSANALRGAILTMTTLANSGHPGGSMSSIDLLLTIYKYANISPAEFAKGSQDIMLVSIGHISPAVYCCLGSKGFFNLDDAISGFRLAGSVYEGHIERMVNGVEWTTGNLGQGLSAACGMAKAAKINGDDKNIFVLMGDGEHQKGQISEARRFAIKYNLDNLIAIVDYNGLQICGRTHDIMPQDLEKEYLADGWAVHHADGHDVAEISKIINKCQTDGKPSLIIAKTVMGKGVSFMENQCKYHGSTLSVGDYDKAMAELGLKGEMDKYKTLRSQYQFHIENHAIPKSKISPAVTKLILYKADASTDCRSAAGAAMTALAEASMKDGATPTVVLDCDLAGSIKTTDIEKNFPSRFIQVGISEHNAASMAGAMSAKGIIPFYTGFTMFAIDEVYNQLRMNDINGSNMKIVSTHAGIDVGEDGRTHQCIDYLGLMKNLFTFKVVAPCDPNQTDHAVRYAHSTYGNVHVVMGRSKVPVITREDGSVYYDETYTFNYGKLDKIRDGKYPLISFGGMLHRALAVRDILAKDGVSVSVYNVATPTCIDEKQLEEMAKAGKIFVLEDHISSSGLFSTIAEVIARKGIACKVVPFGVKQYSYSGTPDQIYKLIQLDPSTVADKIAKSIGEKN